MSTPRMTIVTCCTSNCSYLERTICSVLDQGYPNIQYIVVDATADGSGHAILQTYAEDLDWSCSVAGLSGPAALNLALERAEGEIVAIVESGALLLPGVLHEVARAMEVRDTAWVVGSVMRLGAGEEPVGQFTASQPRDLATFLMRDGGCLPPAGCFVRRSLLEQTGPMDPTLLHAYRFDLVARCYACAGRPALLDRVLVAEHEDRAAALAEDVLATGREYIVAAERLAESLDLAERCRLWRNTDERRRIYALAEAETRQGDARRLLWQQLLRHPWWLANDNYRHSMLHGITHPASSAHAA